MFPGRGARRRRGVAILAFTVILTVIAAASAFVVYRVFRKVASSETEAGEGVSAAVGAAGSGE